jgi:hypothetical protein
MLKTRIVNIKPGSMSIPPHVKVYDAFGKMQSHGTIAMQKLGWFHDRRLRTSFGAAQPY